MTKQAIRILTHALVWMLMATLPFFIEPNRETTALPWLFLLIYGAQFYVNFLILIPQFFFPRKYAFFMLANMLTIGVCAYLKSQLFHQLAPPPHPGGMPKPNGSMIPLPWIMDVVSLLLPTLAALAVRSTERWVMLERKSVEAASSQKESVLQQLKYQLQPHFFFNSMNNIYALIDTSPTKAKEAVLNMSKLMRYMLHDAGQEQVMLSQEIRFIRQYAELMRMRYGSHVQVVMDVPEVLSLDRKIAPLLFLPLVENAFKHGGNTTGPTTIVFVMYVHSDKLIFVAENDVHGNAPEEHEISGIGLQNLVERLKLIYPDKHHFHHYIEQNRFHATLLIHT